MGEEQPCFLVVVTMNRPKLMAVEEGMEIPICSKIFGVDKREPEIVGAATTGITVCAPTAALGISSPDDA